MRDSISLAATSASAQSDAARRGASKEWPTYGHDPNSTRFSPLTEITPANVGKLEVAWVYHMRPAPADGRAGGPTAAVPDKGPVLQFACLERGVGEVG